MGKSRIIHCPVSYTHLDVYKRQMQNIAQTLQLTMSEQRVVYFILNGKQYQILSELDRENRSKPSDLQNIYVHLNSSTKFIVLIYIVLH